jgi:cyclohexanecarboxyl-CoA dehydrogenase
MIPTREQIEFRDLARRFARERLKPGYQARERYAALDRGLLREMGALGLIGVDLPTEQGGLGADGVTAGLVIEEIAYADINVSYVQLLASLLGSLIARFAHPSVARTWLPRVIAGEAVVGLGLTEPRGGSDAANLVLRAERQGGEYVLNGEKNSMSFADQADAMIVFARTGPRESGARGVSAFCVDAGTAGITRTRFDDVGSRIVGRGSVFFDNVRLSPECLMGRENGGFSQVMQGFDYSRALIGLQCAAAAQASLDETWEYVKQREAFGAPIAQYQGVSFPLAEGETMLAAVRQLSYHTLALRDHGERHTAEAAMCKWLAPKTAMDVIHQCLLTHGHYGWTMDLPHQQRLRDVMGLEIGDGTAQIMKLVIARERVGHIGAQHHNRGAR